MSARFADAWREPDHYGWMVGYLRARGLATRARLVIAGATASYLVLPLSMMFSPAGPHGPGPRTAVILAAGAMSINAASIARRWPTRRGAIIRAVITGTAITVICTSYTDPIVGLIGATSFAMLGGYVAFFHSLRLQTLTLGVGLLTATALALRALLSSRDVIATLNLYAVVAVAILALPTTAHVLAYFLGGDLDTSDTDPLTGLLNRRAFYRATHHLLTTATKTAPESPVTHVSVLLIDLDDFKRLNDTHGHRAGDQTLIAVSRLLTEHTAASAVVARIGGEEFLIADLTDPPTAQRCAAHLCATISGIAFDVTASIGIATAEHCAHSLPDDRALIDHLIDLADTAMYDAKRAGGNQFLLHPATP